MAQQSIGGFWLPSKPVWFRTVALTVIKSYLMDASGEKVAFVFRVPKTGTLEKVGFLLGTVTTGQTLKISFQNVSLANGDPDGTADEFRTVTVADGDDDVWKETGIMSDDGLDGGTKRSVTAGDLLAVVIEFDDTVGNLNIRAVAGSAGFHGLSLNSYLDHFTAAWAKASDTFTTISLKYDDGTFPFAEFFPHSGPSTQQSINTGTTPDEAGMIFQVPFPCQVSGLWAHVDGDNAWDLILYDSDGSSVLGTGSFDKDHRSLTNDTNGVVYFPETATLVKDTNYRMIIKPTTASNVGVASFSVDAAALLGHMEGGSAFHWTQRTDAGSWTETTTKRPHMGILISSLDDGVGGGGGGRGCRVIISENSPPYSRIVPAALAGIALPLGWVINRRNKLLRGK